MESANMISKKKKKKDQSVDLDTSYCGRQKHAMVAIIRTPPISFHFLPMGKFIHR